MPSFTAITTTTCDIKRVGPIVAGHQPLPTIIYSGIQCLVPYAVKPNLKFYLGISPAVKIIQTVVRGGLTVMENDTVIIGSGTYPVISVEPWFSRPKNTTYLVLTMEERVP